MLRTDVLLVKQGIVTGRDRAKELVREHRVFINGELVHKPSQKYCEDAIVEIKGELCPYVSRGGLKLEKAIQVFSLSLNGITAIDIGSSTGGFTDCMLQNNAKKVYAIDVGTNQLVSSLRYNPKVVVMEQTNIRQLDISLIKDEINFIGTDVSFLSLSHVLPKAYELLKGNGQMVCLVKPQFEAGPNNVGKNGIVSSSKTHISVLKNILAVASSIGFSSLGLDYSPITGQEGNIEFLLLLQKSTDENKIDSSSIKKIVNNAHKQL